jgi:signal transduction histidine kinase
MAQTLLTRTSIFHRLNVTMVASALLINIIVFLGMGQIHKTANKRHEVLDHLIYDHIQSLVDEFLASDRTFDVVKNISFREQVPFIAINHFTIFKSDSNADWLLNEIPQNPNDDAVQASRLRPVRGPVFFVRKGGWTFAFSPVGHLNQESVRWMEFALIISATTLVSIFNFFVIRRMLNPLNTLRDGVNAVAEGNLDTRIPVEIDDELGTLANAFNEMCKEISRLIAENERVLVEVSHDLRSPLARIRVAAELLEHPKYSTSIVKEVDVLNRLIAAILHRGKITRGSERTESDLQSLIQSLEATIAEEFPDIAWHNEIAQSTFDERNLKIKCNFDQIIMALRNLIDNALKYSPPDANPPEIFCELLDPQRFGIKVVDQGIGIAPENIEKVKDPFFRADPARNPNQTGFGLGLNICDRIMKNHDGQLKIASIMGQGSSITLEFPVT